MATSIVLFVGGITTGANKQYKEEEEEEEEEEIGIIYFF